MPNSAEGTARPLRTTHLLVKLRPSGAVHQGPDGRQVPQIILALTQSKEVKAKKGSDIPTHCFRGGSTLVVDLTSSWAATWESPSRPCMR